MPINVIINPLDKSHSKFPVIKLMFVPFNKYKNNIGINEDSAIANNIQSSFICLSDTARVILIYNTSTIPKNTK